MLPSKVASSSSTVVTQCGNARSPTHQTQTSHFSDHHSATSQPSNPNTPTSATELNSSAATNSHTTPASSVHASAYGKPRLLPSPYGPPPLPIATTTESAYRGGRNLNPSKKMVPVPVSIRVRFRVQMSATEIP